MDTALLIETAPTALQVGDMVYDRMHASLRGSVAGYATWNRQGQTYRGYVVNVAGRFLNGEEAYVTMMLFEESNLVKVA